MENQSGHPQYAMADQGFRPFSSLSSAPSMAQQHVNSSVNAASIQMLPSHPQYAMAYQGFRPLSPLLSAPAMARQHVNSSVNAASIQMPTLPSHIDVSNIDLDVSNIDPSDDGYNWRMCGQRAVHQGKWYPVIHYDYECTQANCGVQKSVSRSADGQNTETLCRGRHNHSRPSERWLTDASVRLERGSQDCVLIEASDAAGTAGPSMPTRAEGGEQSSGSSDEEEDDDGEVRVDGDAAGDANSIERHVSAPAQGITVQTAGEVDVLGNGSRRSQRSGKGRSKSKVWEEFTAVLSGGKVQSAECKHCKKCLSGKSTGGTSHLRRHLKSCPAQPGTSRVQQKPSCSQPDLSVAKNWKLGQENSLEELIRAIVSYLCPFSVMHSASFAQFLAGRNTAFNMVATVEEKFLSVFRNEKSKLKEKITVTPGGVFLSLAATKPTLGDNFDEEDEARFLYLTVHFIDEDWKINRRIITCTYSQIVVISDDAKILPDWKCYNTEYGSDPAGMVLEKAVQDWSLEKKLLGVTLQQSVDKKVTLDLEDKLTTRNYIPAKCKLLAIPCMVGALHNLFDSENSFVKEITRTWSNYMGSSPERKQKYEEVLRQMHLNHPSFLSKGWYVTFYLLEAALQFIKSLPDAELYSRSYPRMPSLAGLKATKSFCNIARLVHDAIKAVSDPHNATSNSYFHVLWSVRKALQESSSMKNIEEVFDIAKMLREFDKNWNEWHSWLSVAVVLDPRYKLSYVEFCYRQAFSHDARMYISKVRAKLYELYIQYFYVNEQSSENNDLQSDISVPLHNWSENYNTQAAVEEFKELHGYLGEGLCPQNDAFDILKWWKSNSSTYPTLAKMARDILAIPGCAVSGESAFDIRDERADLFNGKLRHEIVEAIICAQNWIRSSGTSDADGGNNNVLV